MNMINIIIFGNIVIFGFMLLNIAFSDVFVYSKSGIFKPNRIHKVLIILGLILMIVGILNLIKEMI